MPENFRKIIIYTDGGARGNPGPAGIGVVIYQAEAIPQTKGKDAGAGKVVKKIKRYIGKKTNNEAEYEAIILALGEALLLGAEAVDLFLDSELAVRQLNGFYKVKTAHIQKLYSRVQALRSKFSRVRFNHIKREKNQLADKLVNEAIDQAEER